MDHLLVLMFALSLESSTNEHCPYKIFLEPFQYSWIGAQAFHPLSTLFVIQGKILFSQDLSIQILSSVCSLFKFFGSFNDV